MIAPRANPTLLGQSRAVHELAHAASGSRLHHAWLITGPPGIGKATLAYRFARWLFAAATTPDLSLDPGDPVFRRVAVGSHADLLVIERRYDEKKKRLQGEIIVETVTQAGRFLHLTAGEGGWRVVIVDGAEALNRNAANALLKLLEEPPPRALWLLVSHAPGRLLPTIRSRCRTLACDPLDPATIDQLLTHSDAGLAASQRRRLATLSEGSIGRAITLASAEGLALATLAEEALAAAIPPARAAAIADAVARVEDGFATFVDLLRSALAATTIAAARATPAPTLARPTLARPTLARNVALWQDFARLEAEVALLNLDPRAAIITMLHQLRPE